MQYCGICFAQYDNDADTSRCQNTCVSIMKLTTRIQASKYWTTSKLRKLDIDIHFSMKSRINSITGPYLVIVGQMITERNRICEVCMQYQCDEHLSDQKIDGKFVFKGDEIG